jgi:hypothetical protein
LATPACLTILYFPHVNSPILAALNVFGLFWSTLIISILVYRVSPWHPLAKYPGPLICELTKHYLAFSLFGENSIFIIPSYTRNMAMLLESVRKGTIIIIYSRSSILLGPNELSICNVDAVTPLMGPNGLGKGPSKFTNLDFFPSHSI